MEKINFQTEKFLIFKENLFFSGFAGEASSFQMKILFGYICEDILFGLDFPEDISQRRLSTKFGSGGREGAARDFHENLYTL